MKNSTCEDRDNERPRFKRRTRGLILTYSCNLNCVYCYIGSKCERVISFDVAREAVLNVFNEMKGFDFEEVEIDFVGAEPLTAFARLMQISEWIWSREWNKPYILFATTNGTLLSSEMKEWFFKNRERIVLGLSYDGNTVTQDKNRSGSTASIDLDFFLDTWPLQPLKMTISEDTVSYLAEGVISLHEKGFKIIANPANGMEKWNKTSILEYGKQLSRLVEYYLGNPEVVPSSLISLKLENILASNQRFGNKYCGAGVTYDVADIDGKIYPCHMFSPLVLEEAKWEQLNKIDFSAAEPFECKICEKCILKKICPSCYGLNYKMNGSTAARDISICRLFIIQVLANCKYYGSMLSRKDKITTQEYETVVAIKEIYKYLNIDELKRR